MQSFLVTTQLRCQWQGRKEHVFGTKRHHRKYFLNGVWRILVALLAVIAVLAIFNLIGFWSQTWDLVFWGDPDGFIRSDSYLGRALGLSVLGFLQAFFFMIIAAIAGFVLALLYCAVLRIGGMK